MPQPIGIIHVIHKYDRRAGPDILVCQLLQRLDRACWRPGVFMLDFGNFADASLIEGTLPADVPLCMMPWNGGSGLPAAMRVLRGFARNLQARLLHSHDIPSHLLSTAVPRSARFRKVASVHGVVDQTPRQRQWNALNQVLLAGYDHVFVSAAEIADRIRFVPARRMNLLMNAIDLDSILPAPPLRKDRQIIREAPLRLICIARLSEEKGHGYLLAAMRELLDAPVRLDIIGTGPLEARLRAQAAGLSNVTLHGFVQDPAALLAAADLFCLTSIRESLSLGVLEAMASGRPVLTTDVGALPDVVGRNHAGLVVPKGRGDMIAAAIRAVLADPAQLVTMSENAITTVRRDHSIGPFVAQTQAVYHRVLSRTLRLAP